MRSSLASIAVSLAFSSLPCSGRLRQRRRQVRRNPRLVRREALHRGQGRTLERQLQEGHRLLREAGGALPYGKLAQQAQLEVAYAYFKDKDPVAALAAADRFIKLHPNHPNVDYAYYLKGLVKLQRGPGVVRRHLGQDLGERDPKAARESFEAFKELVTRFPDSRYTPDAMARDALSGQRHGDQRGAHRRVLPAAAGVCGSRQPRAVRTGQLSAVARWSSRR